MKSLREILFDKKYMKNIQDETMIIFETVQKFKEFDIIEEKNIQEINSKISFQNSIKEIVIRKLPEKTITLAALEQNWSYVREDENTVTFRLKKI
jgi:hypothetical protein